MTIEATDLGSGANVEKAGNATAKVPASRRASGVTTVRGGLVKIN